MQSIVWFQKFNNIYGLYAITGSQFANLLGNNIFTSLNKYVDLGLAKNKEEDFSA